MERMRLQLPPRYGEPWLAPFYARLQPYLREGARVLDVGAGRSPVLSPDQRPPGCEYIGLDISANELEMAGPGSYDDVAVIDVTERVPEFEQTFDLALSWQALEHVKPLDTAVENLRSYLRPGGGLVAQLSGAFAAYAVINRLLPHRVSVLGMKRLLGINPDTRFVAHYDRTYHSALKRILADWSEAEVIPLYRGVSYFRFWAPLAGVYLRYENWAARRGMANLATHYLIAAQK